MSGPDPTQRRAWGASSAGGIMALGSKLKGLSVAQSSFCCLLWALQATELVFFSHPLQRLLLQDLHDSHICNSLLVAESEEDIWKSETPYTSYRQRVMPTDGMSAPLAIPQQQCYCLPMNDKKDGNFHAMTPAMSCVCCRLLCRGKLPAPGLPCCHHAVHARTLCL